MATYRKAKLTGVSQRTMEPGGSRVAAGLQGLPSAELGERPPPACAEIVPWLLLRDRGTG